jgi:hypothetical protein
LGQTGFFPACGEGDGDLKTEFQTMDSSIQVLVEKGIY